MKIISLSTALIFFVSSAIADDALLTVKSPEHRVSLLELYTSEGCSSCPPADAFISGLHDAGVNNKQLIPLAFHVTYWDYIGWKDPYASPVNDDRQRANTQYSAVKTIYTPQFVFNGADYRDYEHFSSNVRKAILQIAKVGLTLKALNSDEQTSIELKADLREDDIEDVVFYLVLYENRLVSEVSDGENEGKTLHHDYVVRKIHGPFVKDKSDKTVSFQQVIKFKPSWKKEDLGLVAYAQEQHNGNVLQAVELKLF